MKNKFQKLLKEFRELNLPDGRYAIYGSGPLGVRKIREVNDLDIIVTDELYQKLKEKYSEDAGKERIKIRTSSRTLFLADARNKNLASAEPCSSLTLGIRTWLRQNLVPR